MHIEVSCRHGEIPQATREYIIRKSEKLLTYFERVTQIDVTVDFENVEKRRIKVEIQVDAEHKHDLVAHDISEEVGPAFDAALHKMERQIHKYKEKIQDHRGDMPMGGPAEPLAVPLNEEETDLEGA